jgi:Ni/Co efflux regulator RcnB
MFETFIIFLLAIAIIFIFSFLIFLLGKLYFKYLTKQENDIKEKYFFEREEIKKRTKNLRELEEDYHRKIKILKDFCSKDTIVKFYDKYKIYNLAETLMQERDNLNDYKESFRYKLSKKEEGVLWEYIGNTYVDLKIEDYENIKLKYDFYKENC